MQAKQKSSSHSIPQWLILLMQTEITLSALCSLSPLACFHIGIELNQAVREDCPHLVCLNATPEECKSEAAVD